MTAITLLTRVALGDLRGEDIARGGIIAHECVQTDVPKPASLTLLELDMVGLVARRKLRKRS